MMSGRFKWTIGAWMLLGVIVLIVLLAHGEDSTANARSSEARLTSAELAVALRRSENQAVVESDGERTAASAPRSASAPGIGSAKIQASWAHDHSPSKEVTILLRWVGGGFDDGRITS